MCEIKCTIKVTFSDGSAKPSLGEMVNFAKNLDGDPTHIEAVYKVSEAKAIFIKFRSDEAMQHALNFNAEDLVFYYADGKKANVRMSTADECIEYVRVHDLPPEVPDHELVDVLSNYGKVKRIIREKFPSDLSFDAYTGVRGVYMDVKKEIPTSLHFLNRKGNIFYSGNKDRCFVCKLEGHRMDVCPKRKTRKQPQDGEQRVASTYAGVVSGDASSSNSNQQKETTPIPKQPEEQQNKIETKRQRSTDSDTTDNEMKKPNVSDDSDEILNPVRRSPDICPYTNRPYGIPDYAHIKDPVEREAIIAEDKMRIDAAYRKMLLKQKKKNVNN